MKRISILILGVVIFLSGCSLAPKYSRPLNPIPEHWPSGPAYTKAYQAADVLDASQLRWQEFFTDPKLQQVIQMALQNNRDLRLAALNMERARALYGVQWSKLFPVLNANTGWNKQRYSNDFLAAGSPKVVEQYTVNLGITAWEIDFFGRIRNLSEQALEEYFNTAEARRSAQITLISEASRAYFVIAADQARLNLAYSTLETQENSYNLVLHKFKANLINETDLCRAQTQVDTAKLDIETYTQQIAKDKNALNLLAGCPVPEDLLPVDLANVKPLKDIFPGLSSEVLLRRPDIMAAEHTLKGAYANIGAARAAFFPSISVTTTLGSASSSFSNLMGSGRGTWLYSPQATLPIFNMQTWALYRVSKADQKIALTKYEKTIQTAFREVADVLAVQGTVNQQIVTQDSKVSSAEKVYRITSKRYANGIDSYLSVLDAQRSLYTAQKELIALQLSKLANEVKTYEVLGGGAFEDAGGKSQGNRDALQDCVLSTLESKLR